MAAAAARTGASKQAAAIGAKRGTEGWERESGKKAGMTGQRWGKGRGLRRKPPGAGIRKDKKGGNGYL